MTEENLNQGAEVPETTPNTGSESEELGNLLNEDEDVPVTREEFNALKKGVSKFFSEKGREEKATKTVEAPKETPTQSSDDVTELFLESKPEAGLVLEDLQKVADAKYNGSIIKAWKGEEWLHEKAQALSETNKAKSKIQSPSNQIEGEIDFKTIKAEQISKLSDKDYSRYQEYMRKQSNTPGRITLS
jgi:hypothetical protein